MIAQIDAAIAQSAMVDVSAIGKALSQASRWPGCPRVADLSPDGVTPSYRRIVLRTEGERPYEALLILWPAEHVTPIHDHQGLWGLEYVLDGVLEVQSYELLPSPAIHLEPRETIVAGVGDYLTFSTSDYAHRCRNFSKSRQALTLHVYGGSLDSYRSFHADGDAWSCEHHQSAREEVPV
ncbi:cysteine dioxygenase family protein [Dyella sp. C9]|uniref:cysteine dioxygenase n=1 Tax=Dyella sp. C9 TaxID=2202154 RepID=UPI0013007ED4|nr:cysteine dioxygenase family protein [Dyella sp. C9]